jgi:DNA-binding FrmR family transcriptional regulator
LRRIVGQVLGIRAMLSDSRKPAEILMQISAAQAALGQVGRAVLGHYLSRWLAEAPNLRSEPARESKLEELLDVLALVGAPARPKSASSTKRRRGASATSRNAQQKSKVTPLRRAKSARA